MAINAETDYSAITDKTERKMVMKKDAKKLGISYKELKERSKKKRTREAESLEDEEHKKEIHRMRSYSKDFEGDDTNDAAAKDADGNVVKRRRTRSMDVAEEQKALADAEKKLSPDEWRKEHTITLRGHGENRSMSSFPAPYIEFQDTPYSARIQRSLTGAGFARPSPIQAQAWPLAVQGKDLISIAKTGSGKTCGFLLPVFHHHEQTQQDSPKSGGGGFRRNFNYVKPILLVLAPTRELSVQILEEAQKFGRPLGIRSVCCYGGSSKFPQIQALQRGVECIIACPGRLNDLIEMKKVDLSGIKFLVLDEADRMLDMGFEPQIRSIVDKVPKERQTLLFSATWPKEIQRLAHDFLMNPIQINVGEVDALVANKDIKQSIVMCREDEKLDKLETILKELTAEAEEDKDALGDANRIAGGGKAHAKVIVFVAKKISCHDLANKLWEDGFAVDALHGDRPQWERSKVMQAFKNGTLRMLIATDIAARGLDVKDVGVVVNYDMPAGVNAVEDYVHRIGRTGRAGAKGKAYTFFTDKDKKCATQLVEVLKKAEQDIPAELQAMARPRFGGNRFGGRGGGRGYGRGRGGYGGGGGRGYMSGGYGRDGGGRGRGFGRGRGGGGRGGRRY